MEEQLRKLQPIHEYSALFKNICVPMAQHRACHHCCHHHDLHSGGRSSKRKILTVSCGSWLAEHWWHPVTVQMMVHLKWRNVTFMGSKRALVSQQCSVVKRDSDSTGWYRLFANGIEQKVIRGFCYLCNVKKFVGSLGRDKNHRSSHHSLLGSWL